MTEAPGISRRSFLKIATALGAAVLLGGCNNPGENTPSGEKQKSTVYTDLERDIGPEWKDILAGNLAEAYMDNDTDTPDQALANTFIVAGLSGESVIRNKLLEKVSMELVSNGDPVLNAIQVDAAANNGKIRKFYFESIHKGFVVNIPDEHIAGGAWYKFFQLPEGNKQVLGYYDQSMKLWRENLNAWGIPGEDLLKYGTTMIDGTEYVYYCTPTVGSSLTRAIQSSRWGENTAEVSKSLVLDWFKNSASKIRDGNYAAVHWDPHVGNLQLIEEGDVRRLVPIDWDAVPMAFDNPETAAKVLAKRVIDKLGPDKIGNKGLTFTVSKAELENVLSEVFSKQMEMKPSDFTMTVVKMEKDMKEGGKFGVRFFYNKDTFKGVEQGKISGSLSDAMNKLSDMPKEVAVDLSQTGVAIENPTFKFNAGGSSIKALSETRIKLAKAIEALRPVFNVGARVVDLLAIYYSIVEINKGFSEPYMFIDRSSDWAISTEKLAMWANLKNIVQVMDTNYALNAQEVFAGNGACGNMFPELCNAIKIFEDKTGIKIYRNNELGGESLRGVDPATYQESLRPTLWLRNNVENVIRDAAPWIHLNVKGFSAIPFISGEETPNNMFVKMEEYEEEKSGTISFGGLVENEAGNNINTALDVYYEKNTDGNVAITGYKVFNKVKFKVVYEGNPGDLQTENTKEYLIDDRPPEALDQIQVDKENLQLIFNYHLFKKETP